MVQITGDVTLWVMHFLLMLTRMTALFTLSPVFGRTNVPAYLKTLTAMMMTLLIVNYYPPPAEMPWPTLFHFALAVGGELLVGLSIGFVTTLFSDAVFTAGQIIDTQIGFGMVQVYDVTSNIQIPIAGSLLNMILLLCFLGSNGHLKLIQMLYRTFDVIPVGRAVLRPELSLLMLEGFVKTFIIAISLAMPIIASGLLAEVGLGLVMRTAPQMNMFVIGIPLKTILGLLMLAVLIPPFVAATGMVFDQMYGFITDVFETMLPA